MRELIRQAVVLTAAEDDLRIHVDIDPADTMIYADKTQLGQVAVNLLKNASRGDCRAPLTARSKSARGSMRPSMS